MAWGVEARVPFLDRRFLEVAMGFDPTQKMCGGKKIEKHILRSAFDCPVSNNSDKKYLPDEILWRQKEQFSDGVGYSWIDGLKAYANKQVTDAQLAQAEHRFPIHTPKTKEAYLVRSIYNDHFPSDAAARCCKWQDSIACSSSAALKWDASFQNRADDSGRSVIGVHNAAYGADFKTALK